MKYLFLFLVSFSSYSVCLTETTGTKFKCEHMSSVSASNWCFNKFGSGFKAYRTTESCNIELQSKYINGYFERNLFNIETIWNKKYRKSLSLSCMGDLSYLCHKICDGQRSCDISEGVCKDCVGTTIDLTNLFKNVGLAITATNKSNIDGLVELVNSNNFVSFTSKSIYNIISSYDSKGMKRRFKSLCNDETEYPVIFASVYEKTREIISFSYVACKTGVFELSSLNL